MTKPRRGLYFRENDTPFLWTSYQMSIVSLYKQCINFRRCHIVDERLICFKRGFFNIDPK